VLSPFFLAIALRLVMVCSLFLGFKRELAVSDIFLRGEDGKR
jgi:hypothetical protein